MTFCSEEAIETTTPSRRRTTPPPTQKTVLNVHNNRNKFQENTQIKDTREHTLTGNKGLLDDIDEYDSQFNVIALPTEPVTENVPYPENILTTKTPFTTKTPQTSSPSIQVTESLIENDIIDSLDDESNQIETTTYINGLNIIESLSKQNDILSQNLARVNSVAPRPFSRPSLTRTKAPGVVNENFVNSRDSTQSATSRRSRPTPARTSTEKVYVDNEVESTSRAPASYRPGYRGTARFRASSVRSGQYDRVEDNLDLSNYQPIENNRLRALDLENQRTRPLMTATPKIRETTKRLGPLRPRITPSTAAPVIEVEEDEETTTEQRIVEAKNRFNLADGERPERIRFELAVGRKIDFGFTPAAKVQSKSTDPSKVKVITGKLDQSPLVSHRGLKPGHVEEIPLSKSPVTVESFSGKLNLNQIPLNKSDIESFVADEDLRTNLPLDETTTRRIRLRPSILGFTQRSGEETTTESAEEETSVSSRLRPTESAFVSRNQQVTSTAAPPTSSTAPLTEESTSRFRNRFSQRTRGETSSTAGEEETTTRKLRLRPSIKGLTKNVSTEAIDDDETTTPRARLRPSKIGFQTTIQEKIEESSSAVPPSIEESTSRFRNRLSQRIKTTSTEDDSTTKRARPLQNRLAQRPRLINSSNEANEVTEGAARTKPSPFKSRFSTRPRTSQQTDSSADESADEETATNRVKPSAFKNRLTTKSRLEVRDQYIDSKVEESTTSKTRLRPSILTKVRASDIKIEDVNDLQTESPDFDETTDVERTSWKPKTSRFGGDTNSIESSTDIEGLNLVTEKFEDDEFDDDDNEIDFTTQSSSGHVNSNNVDDDSEEEDDDDDDDDEETTIQPIIEVTSTTRRSVVIRKRPVKKIDAFATRQTITEATQEESEDDNEDETTRTSTQAVTRARKLVSRKRVESESQGLSQDTADVTPPRTTRKRIIYSRPRPQKNETNESESNDDDDDDIELSENDKNVSEPPIETSEKPNDSSTRRRIKVYRERTSTPRVASLDDESTSARSPVSRTRVFKRPLQVTELKTTTEGESETKSEDEEATSPRSNSRFGNGRQRKIVKVNRKPIASEDDQSNTPEIKISSGSPPKRVFKILRTKTPKLLVDRPLVNETSAIKTDDENQEVENGKDSDIIRLDFNNNEEELEAIDEVSQPPSGRPILKFPTKNSAGRVTIKKRPAFNQGRTSTIHPASTRLSKDSLPTRAKSVTVRRKQYKPTIFNSETIDTTADEITPEKKLALGERNKKIFTKGYNRKSLSTTSAPNITPLTDTETTEYDEDADTTVIPLDNNDENILQKGSSPTKPRFSLSRFTTTTTVRPTTLHHVFAIDVEEEDSSNNKTKIKENQADEVIKKLQKLIEINRIVEVYSKEEKLKVLKNKKLKSIKQSELTLEAPPKLESFGQISRETIIKLVKRNETTTTEAPTDRSPKNVVFAETVFPQPESSTIALEGLFEREKKSHEQATKEDSVEAAAETNDSKVSASRLRAPAPLLRPESNETNPIIISLASLDKVILSKVQIKLDQDLEENLPTTESADKN